jgi:hypothetical protein
MAIARGTESKEAQGFKRYIGVAPVFIKAINPTKKEHEELFNTTLEEDPSYVGTVTDSDGNECANARIQIVFQPDNEKLGFEMPLVTMALFIQNKARVGGNSGKTQVVDKYGRFAWATPEELASKSIPTYANGAADIDKDYRPAYVGEEDLIEFVRAYLCIPSVTVWDKDTRTMVPNPRVKSITECECRFDNLDKIFKGDFSEIKDALGYQPTNKVKIMLGVRTDVESGRLYQSVYTKKFLKNSSNSYATLDKELQDMVKNAATNGRTLNVEYAAVPAHEYSVEATTFTPTTVEAPSTVDDLPFDTNDSQTPW